MKRSDITDEHVLELAHQLRADGGPDLVQRLQAEGIPRKVALAKLQHMNTRELLDYGVCIERSWPADY